MTHAPASIDSDSWEEILSHRAEQERQGIQDRFLSHGVSSAIVAEALRDGGATLAASALSRAPEWSVPYGGLVGAALVAGEVAAHASWLVSRAASVRSLAVENLLEDISAVTLAQMLGISRQKVYEIARSANKVRAKQKSNP